MATGFPLTGDVVWEVVQLGPATVVGLQGDVDMHQAPRLHERLTKVTADKPIKLVIDMSKVRYIDSSGVATIISAFQRMHHHHGKLCLAGMQPRVRSVFEIAQLDRILPMFAGREEALQA